MGSFGSGPAGPSTSRQDRLVKLSVADPAKSAALREALSQHYYAQYTFTPRINDNSRRIVEEVWPGFNCYANDDATTAVH